MSANVCLYLCVSVWLCVCLRDLAWLGWRRGSHFRKRLYWVWVQSCVFSLCICVCVCLEHLAWLEEREREPLRASSPVWRAPPPIATTPSHCQLRHHHRNHFFINLLPALLSLSPFLNKYLEFCANVFQQNNSKLPTQQFIYTKFAVFRNLPSNIEVISIAQ